jgi:DNA processing protein
MLFSRFVRITVNRASNRINWKRLKVMDQESLKYWIALRAVDEVGCVGFKNLLQSFSSPQEVFSANPMTLRVIPGIGPVTADHIRSFRDWGMAEREVQKAVELGISIVTCDDALYPRNLLNIYDRPPFLYLKGSLCPEEICVAVVGSRLASVYGRYTTEKISRELALKGITIVSGLARGIDAAAHRGALAGKGRTIAVLGCGLDIIYPPENEELAVAVAAEGAVVTEFPFGTPPNAPNFPSRNRIISGISLGVVVVEAGEKSGSLITARIAAEQGRSVFAVPGQIGVAGSRGTHRLIKQGAVLIENVEDILEEILPQAGLPPSVSPLSQSALLDAEQSNDSRQVELPGVANREQQLLSFITSRPVDIDTLIQSTGLAAQEVLNTLLLLELRGLIRQIPGKQFLRKESQN